MTDVTTDESGPAGRLSAADEQLLRELTERASSRSTSAAFRPRGSEDPRHDATAGTAPGQRQQGHRIGSASLLRAPRAAGVNGMTGPAAATASLCAHMPPLSSSGAQPRPPVQRG